MTARELAQEALAQISEQMRKVKTELDQCRLRKRKTFLSGLLEGLKRGARVVDYLEQIAEEQGQ